MERVPIDFWEKKYIGLFLYVVYSLSIDKDTISPYLGFLYLSSEAEMDFYKNLGLSNLNDENS